MAVFRYTASSPGEKSLARGELTADSAYQVRAALRRMGLLPVRISEVREANRADATHVDPLGLRAIAERIARGRRRADTIELYEGLAALLSTGTPLAGALELLAGTGGNGGMLSGKRSRPTRTATLCRHMTERIRSGGSLGDAMEDRGDWFSPIDAALVRSAEGSGSLDRTLTELAEESSRSEETRGRFAGALAYPALLSVFGLGVVVFLTTTTLPQLAGALTDAGVELPRTTGALLWLGESLVGNWSIVFAFLLTLVGIAAWSARSDRVARFRLRLPLIGRALLRTHLASTSLLLARLLRAGVPLTRALELVCPTIGNAAIRGAFDGLRSALYEGRSIAPPLQESGLFEPVYCRVLDVGQESGELPAALETIGRRYRHSSRRLIDRIATVLEPTVILMLAVLIGFVVYAAIAPMLRLTQTL